MSFEGDKGESVRRTRRDGRDTEGETIAYQNPAGNTQAVTGDDLAPYVSPLGRVAETAEGVEGAIGPEGAHQRLLVTPVGVLYATPAPQVALDVEVTTETDAAAEGLSDAIDVSQYRTLSVYLTYVAGAAGGQVSLQVLVNAQAEAPTLAGVGSDGWLLAAVSEWTTAADTDAEAVATVRNGKWKTPAAAAAAQTVYATLDFNVASRKWARISYGYDPQADGTITVRYNLSN